MGDGYGDQLRRAAAAALDLEERQVRLAETLEQLAGLGVEVGSIRDQAERGKRFMQQLGAIHAAQALAYDALMAAGGPENSRAYVEYEAATKRNTELLPRGLEIEGAW
ncbi:hypothetical protein [Amycolatopsis nigrescens]|uniref:hypothetical protein n=1 Tax=Amycolatopsis nigrescens TaxID=381445 RepID=UPI000381D4DB|nr:hypothetical protein [Amycolatopsis nigrescens]